MVALAAGIAGGAPLVRITATSASSLAARQLILMLTGCFGLLSERKHYRPPRAGESVAEAVTRSLGVAPTAKTTRALDAALILSADHELNPATFVARIAASSEGDLHSCIAAAISTNAGPRIAGACDRFEQLFRRVPAARTSTQWKAALGESELAAFVFSHPLYPDGDPRGRYLLEIVRQVDSESRQMRKLRRYLDAAQAHFGGNPRLEATLALLVIALGFPAGTAAGLYTLARVAGCVAHIAEQRLAGYLIRPRAKFTGSRPGAGSESVADVSSIDRAIRR
jgi:citrate synthase